MSICRFMAASQSLAVGNLPNWSKRFFRPSRIVAMDFRQDPHARHILKPRLNEDASWCKLMRVASLACACMTANSHQLASTLSCLKFWCKHMQVNESFFARLTGHESCCMRVVDKFWTASGFYFVATGSTKRLSVFLVNFRSTLIDSHASLVLVWPSIHASSCKSMQTLVCQLVSTRILVWPGLNTK